MSTKISGMAASSGAVLTDILPAVHVPGGVPDTTGPQKVTIAQIRGIMVPIALGTEVSGLLAVGGISPSVVNGQVLTTVAGATAWAGVAVPAGTGLRKVAGGTETVATLVDADVAAGAAISGSKIAPNFGAQVVVTTLSVAVGTTPAAAGQVRMPSNASITARNSINTADYNVAGTDGADVVLLGDYASNASQYRTAASGSHLFRGGAGNNRMTIATISLLGSPLIGDASEPVGYHGISGVAQITPIAGATRTEAAANYAMRRLVYAAGAGSACLVTMPTPASLSAYYEKTFENNSGFTMTFTCGAGTQRTVLTGNVAVLGFHSTGDVKNVSAGIAP